MTLRRRNAARLMVRKRSLKGRVTPRQAVDHGQLDARASSDWDIFLNLHGPQFDKLSLIRGRVATARIVVRAPFRLALRSREQASSAHEITPIAPL